MRRSFNADLLVNTYQRSTRAYRKATNNKNDAFKAILFEYIALCGDRFGVDSFAAACGVQKRTAQKWLYGYQASEGLLYPIARYFADYAGVDKDAVYNNLLRVLGRL
jgi:hypothetical protein